MNISTAAKKVVISTGVEIHQYGDGIFSLIGALDFNNAGQVMAEGQKLFAGHGSIVVDTSAAEVSSTAGLAVMMEWASWCEIRDIELVYEGFHAKALAVAEMNGVTMMLPTATGIGARNRQDSVVDIIS